MDPMDPMSTRQLSRAIHAAADAAKINKRVPTRARRQSFATHLLEQKVDNRIGVSGLENFFGVAHC
jgi:site-specific recombinase XerD